MKKDMMVAWMEEGMLVVPQMLMANYHKLGLNETELVILLQIFSFIEEGKHFPTLEEISGRMTISSSECSDILRRLIQKQCLTIEEGYSSDHIRFESYSLKPLWHKLVDEMMLSKKEKQFEEQLKNEENLYTTFEQEFGRPLSPLECETLAMWVDQDFHDAAMIKSALREAVIAGKLNFRYIDRILFEWKKNGIKTIEQARQYGKKFHQQRVKSSEVKKSSNMVPFYNWLEQ
ncbi:DnaD domain-containing protein [Bacillus chungangensis]|uniref:DNA replication protein n=1 Tax=Bacillus chungangensis TaxID=587633 RepID=A0ABT9WS89_9BACI|nr:DnaD domain-containing protein [Bacillus chungangensis]MDQ0176167.1 DNA replication protein [Bacillus chungangensis]